MKLIAPAVWLALAIAASPAAATEAFGGLFAHNIDLPTTIGSPEGGIDFQLGLRSDPLALVLKTAEVRAYAFGSVNSEGGVDFAAAGAALRFPLDGNIYIQPGLGLAIHDGPDDRASRSTDKLYLGSRILFQPELAVGWTLSSRWSAEFGWVHLSHATILSGQNPGLDDLGMRIVHRF